jgi:two-component system OmpR family sensor kinase
MSSETPELLSEAAPRRRRRTRPLRFHLMLWYGAFVVFSLSIFALLFLWLVTSSLYQGVNDTINAEARVAVYDLQGSVLDHQLQVSSLPENLNLITNDVINNGVVFEIYAADKKALKFIPDTPQIPEGPGNEKKLAIERALTGLPPEPYTATDHLGNRWRVGVYAITCPIQNPTAGCSQPSTPQNKFVGVVVVAKALSEVDSTIFRMQTLLLLSGCAVLIIALAGGWIISAKVLQPLSEIVKTARSVASTVQGPHIGSLSQRVRRSPDLDEMVQVVDTFNDMLASLESATLTQRRFIADASHELRAPLTTIQGNLAFLQRHIDDLPSEERRTMLNDAHGETLRLARLVDELLLLARADANSENSLPSKQDHILELDHILLQLIRQLRGRLSVDKSKIRLEVGHIEPMRIRGDEEILRRILLILIDNALKYTPQSEDNPSGRITISLKRITKDAVVQIADTGIGIDPSDLPHIFERFYRADRARSRKGTGLGLSIAQTLVEQLGGRISAQSVPGKGSVFSLWLPLT